jgi:hypothetical protein
VHSFLLPTAPSPALTLAEVVEINPKTASEKDDNLPSPPNLSQCSTSQLAYLFNKLCKEEDSKASTNQREMVKQVALQILSTCSHAQILEPHTLSQIPVLALMDDDDILKELMRVLMEKIRDEALIDRYKLRAISQVVCYGGSRLKDPNMVLQTLSLISKTLDMIRVNDEALIFQCLESITDLLDAVMTLDVQKVEIDTIQKIFDCLEQLHNTSSSQREGGSVSNPMARLIEMELEYANQGQWTPFASLTVQSLSPRCRRH